MTTALLTVELAGRDPNDTFFDDMEVYELTGREQINQPFEYVVSVAYQSTTPLDIANLLNCPVTIRFRSDGNEQRRVHGMIANVRDRMTVNASYILYDLTVVPTLWDLSRIHPTAVFLNSSVTQILEAKLTAAQLEASDFSVTGVTGSYATREFVLQYKESDLDFVKRQCEHYGIRFHFDHSGDADRLVFTDGELPLIDEADPELMFQPGGELTGVYEMTVDHACVSSHVICKDYNYRTPLDIVSNDQNPSAVISDDGAGAVVDYGSHLDDGLEADRIAAVRAGELGVHREQYRLVSDEQKIAAGRRFTLVNHPRTPPQLLIIEATYFARQPATGLAIPAEDQKFEVKFSAIAASRNYRPPRVTPKPRIHGVLPAVIQHDAVASGPGLITSMPDLDAQGRYIVKFKFDDRLTADGIVRVGSHRIRMFQPMSGIGYGVHFPLRKGVEVVVAFEDGDPDRPVILGAGYNPVLNDPVSSSTQSLNRIKTESGILVELDDGAGGGTGNV